MLEKIGLKNFVSYADLFLGLGERRLVSISGDIGSGKSSLLKAILFALYGEYTGKLEKLVYSKNVDDGMSVSLDIEINGKILSIVRGWRGSGTGFLKAEYGGALVSSGGSTQKNIDALLGQGANMFMLTSFFGGENDFLIGAAPSKRLEILQEAVGAAGYSKVYDKLGDIIKPIESKMFSLQGSLESVKGRLADFDSLKSLTNKLSSMKSETKHNKESLTALIREKGVIEKNIAKYELEYRKYLRLTSQLKEVMLHCEEVVADCLLQRQELEEADLKKKLLEEKKMKLNDEVDALSALGLNKLLTIEKDLLSKASLLFQLYGTAIQMHAPKCPLCSGDLSAEEVLSWGDKVKYLDGEIVSRTEVANSLSKKWARYLTVSELESVCKKQIAEDVLYIGKLKKRISLLEKKRVSFRERISLLEKEIQEVAQSFNTVSALKSEVDTIIGKIDSCKDEVFDLRLKVDSLGRTVMDRAGLERELSSFKRDYAALAKQLSVYKLLRKAFSRYEIPYRLLKDFRSDVEDEASRLLNYFIDGYITLKDTEERGNPGIDFCYVNSGVELTYTQWSNGQRAIIGLVLRIAIALVLRREKMINTDFLILDEVAAFLSGVKRDALAKFVSRVLAKNFTQIFMVSHSAMRDIFTDSFEVRLVDGKSLLGVV